MLHTGFVRHTHIHTHTHWQFSYCGKFPEISNTIPQCFAYILLFAVVSKALSGMAWQTVWT